MRSVSSATTVAPASTASSGPSSVRTFPRRKTSHGRCSSSVRSTRSSEPASSVATRSGSSSCLRTERFLHVLLHPAAVGAPLHLLHHRAHDAAHVLGRARARRGHGLRHEVVQLVVADVGREVRGDEARLVLLLLGELGALALAELPGGVEPALALAAEHGLLVAGALLGVLLELGEHEAERARAVLVTRLERGGEVGLHLIEDL